MYINDKDIYYTSVPNYTKPMEKIAEIKKVSFDVKFIDN
jgi:hypothetical protein